MKIATTDAKHINNSNIFAIPVGDYFGQKAKDFYLIYSPLSGSMFILDHTQIEEFEDSLLRRQVSPSFEKFSEAIEVLLDFEMDPGQLKLPKNPGQYRKMSIIPNYKCNFSCSYCYSAVGRSDKEISRETLQTAIDFLFESNKTSRNNLKFFVSGGGEPLLSWDVLKFGLDYAYDRADRENIRLETQIMTNGSILTDEMISFFIQHNIRICVSFEILEEIQNKHRKNYQLVLKNIAKLVNAGLRPSISSTITKESVALQSKMFSTMLDRFPEIAGINFDPVLAPELFTSPADLQQFFDDFIKYFMIARQENKSYHVIPYCSMCRLLDNITLRYCPGKLCVTPESTISICHSITSPKEKDYQKYIYGKIDDQPSINFDEQKFQKLIGNNVLTREKCQNCFAKWHCGGGCIMQNTKYSGEENELICYFTRKFIRQLLLERLEEEYSANNGPGLKEVVLNS
jgi:radical SAM protein with 4Fe4S-binding SPASM domain